MKLLFKKRCQILAMLLGVSVFILTACGSKEEVGVVKETIDVAMEDAVAEVAGDELIETVVMEETVVGSFVEETVESTTEERPVYEGIDMESPLPGAEWIQTFAGIIDEPKVVIYSDETGKKQIVEDGDRVNFNPDIDMMALYLPEGAKIIHSTKGIAIDETANNESCGIIIKLDADETRERGRISAALYAEVDGKEIELPFDFKPE